MYSTIGSKWFWVGRGAYEGRRGKRAVLPNGSSAKPQSGDSADRTKRNDQTDGYWDLTIIDLYRRELGLEEA